MEINKKKKRFYFKKNHLVHLQYFGLFLFLLIFVPSSHAGSPFILQSSGAPFLWDTSTPVPFSPDGGNLGLWNNTTAVANTLEAFNRWGPDLPTSALTFSNAGAIPGDGDVNTVAEYNALDGNCSDGISPVIFDSNGSLFAALGLPSSLIGFAGPDCGIIGTGKITQGIAAINGKWFDGNPSNGELTEAEFKGTFVHEFGHWLNLDHSQVNGQYYLGDTDPGFVAFGVPPLSSVEVMFAFSIGGATVPVRDDIATVSRLYPDPSFQPGTGTITGTILLQDGVTPFKGANVVARNIADPFYDAVSNVSGVAFSSPPSDGYYEVPGLTDGASYAIELASVNSQFTGGSGLGPFDPPHPIPGPEEFYNGLNEASTFPPDDVSLYTSLVVSGGNLISGIDVIINVPSADLSVNKTDSPDPVLAGTDLTYTINVINNGPDGASGVILIDTLPLGVNFVSVTSTQGSCSEAAGEVTCNLGNLDKGAGGSVEIMVVPTQVGDIDNTVMVSGNESDSDESNNSATETTTIIPGSADLSIVKSDSSDPVLVGGNITYLLNLSNNGPSIGTGVEVTDNLPGGVTFVNAIPSQGSCSETSGTVTCSMGSLANGSIANVTIVVTTNSEGIVSNSAAISGFEADPNASNNTATEDTTVSLTVETPINNSPGDQQTQSVAWNPVDQEYLVVWHDRGTLDIRGARLDQFGNVIAAELPIVVDAERQAGPWVAYGGIGGNRGYMAVWIQGRAVDPTGTDIHGAWILPDGTVQSTFVVTDKTANQRAASVVYDPVANRFLVTWIDDEKGLNNRDVYRSVLLPGGGVHSGPAGLLTSGSDQRGPYAKYDYGNSRYFMVWFDNAGGIFDVMGSRVNANGNLLNPGGIIISAAGGHQRNPRITDRRPADGINNFTLAWIDFRNGQPDIYGTLIDENGIPTTADFEIAGGPSNQRAASIDIDYIRTNQAMVSWIDDVNGTDVDIYRAQVDQGGIVTGATLVVGQGTGAANDQRGPLVSYSADGVADNGFLIIWRDNRGGVDYDLFGLKVFP